MMVNGLFRWGINIDGTVPPGEENLNLVSETEQNVAASVIEGKIADPRKYL